jgi:Rps23 Pro-64 3,4-dihydroxylase Tpa1-like proline 4-hydroxylase
MDGTKPTKPIAIARRHDAGAYARVYRKRGRIRIQDFLEPSSAEALTNALSRAPFAHTDGRESREPFQFETAPLAETSPLLKDFIAGTQLVAFLSAIAGTSSIAEVQVARFGAGHFQSLTKGKGEKKKHIANFALNLTRGWKAEWGGLLLFNDDAGNIAEGHVPEFNSLSLFHVPQLHFISQVSLAYARVFDRYGRLHIPDFLTPASAIALHGILAKDVTYDTIFNEGDSYYQLKPHESASLSPEERRHIAGMTDAHARHGFQYFYETHKITETGEPYKDPRHPLRLLTDFLESAAFLEFVRTVTGNRRIAFADAQATRYRPGNFLTQHDDRVSGSFRQAAYVLNLTQLWRADWGGLLLFTDEDGHVAEGYTPAFNAINLFRVPQPHLVTQVASYAGADRLSVTGWLRSR